jgi:c(7)-type cytochrome triheme protein
MSRHPRLVLAALALTLGAAVVAAELPRLPKPILVPKGEDSPGQVTFNHESHVDAQKPSCTACHPKVFPMLKESALAKGVITHEKMEKGQYCGACHGKGKAAFAFDDGCENCHAQ